MSELRFDIMNYIILKYMCPINRTEKEDLWVEILTQDRQKTVRSLREQLKQQKRLT